MCNVCMLVMCNDIVIVSIEYDKRRPAWLSTAPLDIEHNNNRGHRDTPIT